MRVIRRARARGDHRVVWALFLLYPIAYRGEPEERKGGIRRGVLHRVTTGGKVSADLRHPSVQSLVRRRDRRHAVDFIMECKTINWKEDDGRERSIDAVDRYIPHEISPDFRPERWPGVLKPMHKPGS